MTRLLLGPLLRHVGTTDATIWVETDTPCEVEILGHRERTWTVAGHHYALVAIEGLAPDSSTTYSARYSIRVNAILAAATLDAACAAVKMP